VKFFLFSIFLIVFLNSCQSEKPKAIKKPEIKNTVIKKGPKEVWLSSGEWRPYLSKDLPHYGMGSYFVNKAFEEEGYKVKYLFYPWKRSIELAKNGEEGLDGSLLWSSNEERRKVFYFSDPVLKQNRYLYHRKDQKFEWDGLQSLSQTELVLMNGYAYGDTFEKARKEGVFKKIFITKSEEQALKMIYAKRAEATILLRKIFSNHVKKAFPKKEQREVFTFHPVPLDISVFYVILHKGKRGKELQAIFNRGLKKIKEKYGEKFVESTCSTDIKMVKTITESEREFFLESCK
jgi:polar amino acid transport system substrate-binding protein